ncbi:hypothetical protein [Actinomadura verrucosospora]|nr:hypothetical protein [Actinomadura verrucosospora]
MSIMQRQEPETIASTDLPEENGAGAAGEGPVEQGSGVEHRFVAGAWEVTMRWPVPAAAGPVEMVIRGAPGAAPGEIDEGITVDVLRSIPLARISRAAKAESSMVQRTAREDYCSETIDGLARQISRAARSVRRPGRAGRPDEFFAFVAAIYSWYVDLGYSDPVRKVGEATGCGWRSVANWVRLAREKGMLAEASPGRPGGVLTERALRLLEARDRRFSEVLVPDGGLPNPASSGQ